MQGRSAFEPPLTQERSSPSQDAIPPRHSSPPEQQYDARGRPESAASRELVRRARRARNDVLATVGVCVHVDESGKVVARADADEARGTAPSRSAEALAVLEENETGLWLELADGVLGSVTWATFATGLRQQIQTYAFFTDVPLRTIVSSKIARHGRLRVFFTGVFASVLDVWLHATLSTVADFLPDYLLSQWASKEDTNATRARKVRAINFLTTTMTISNRLLILPLQFYGTLQHLGLLPAWPLVPNPFRHSYFLPLLPTTSHGSTYLAYGAAILTSPVALLLGLEYLDRLESTPFAYARAAIPRPDNPDAVSRIMKSVEGHEAENAVLDDYPLLQGSLQEEVHKDWSRLVETFYVTRAVVRHHWRNFFRRKRPAVEFPDEVEEILLSPRPSNLSPETGSMGNALRNGGTDDGGSDQPLPPLQTRGETATPHRPTSPGSSTASEDPDSPLVQPPNVQVRTRTGSTSTLHMDVEINAPAAGAAPLTSSFSSSPRTVVIDQVTHQQVQGNPSHRVTALSLAPARMLTLRVSRVVVTVLKLPLESMFLRSLALGYLAASPDLAQSAWLRSQIYPVGSLFQPRLGFSSWHSALDYTGKIFLCLGVDFILDLELWRVMSALVRWFGKRTFSWGNL